MINDLVYLDGLVAKEHLAKYEIKHHSLFISPQVEGAFSPFFLDITNISRKEHINKHSIKIDLIQPNGASLIVKGDALIQELTFLDPSIFEMDDITKLAFGGYQKIILLTAAFIACVIALYIYVLPEVAENMVTLITVEQEQYLGEVTYDNMLDNFDVDSAKSQALKEFASHIDFDSKYELKYTVVHADISNAFALPGGNIVVFDKLIDETKSEKELAALLAHEVSHIEHRHSLKAMFRALAGYFFIALLLNDINGLTTIIIDNANTLKTLAFSRSLEEEADLRGLEILRKNQIDQHGMVQLLHQISEGEDLDIDAVQFLSTHPITKERIAYINKEIDQNPSESSKNESLQLAWEKLRQ